MSLKSFFYIMIVFTFVMGITFYDSASSSVYANTSAIAGFKSFTKTCTKCHVLRNPKNYTKKVWSFNVNRMSKRAKISSSQKKTIISLWNAEGISRVVKKWNKANK